MTSPFNSVQCPICDREFGTHDAYRQHYQMKHSEDASTKWQEEWSGVDQAAEWAFVTIDDGICVYVCHPDLTTQEAASRVLKGLELARQHYRSAT